MYVKVLDYLFLFGIILVRKSTPRILYTEQIMSNKMTNNLLEDLFYSIIDMEINRKSDVNDNKIWWEFN